MGCGGGCASVLVKAKRKWLSKLGCDKKERKNSFGFTFLALTFTKVCMCRRVCFQKPSCHKQTYSLVPKKSGLSVWLARIRLCKDVFRLWESDFVPWSVTAEQPWISVCSISESKDKHNRRMTHSYCTLRTPVWVKVSILKCTLPEELLPLYSSRRWLMKYEGKSSRDGVLIYRFYWFTWLKWLCRWNDGRYETQMKRTFAWILAQHCLTKLNGAAEQPNCITDERLSKETNQ